MDTHAQPAEKTNSELSSGTHSNSKSTATSTQCKSWIQTHKHECVAGSLMLLLLVGGAGVVVIQQHAKLNSAKEATSVTKSKTAEKIPELGNVAQNAVGEVELSDVRTASSSASTESGSANASSSESSSGSSNEASTRSSAQTSSSSSQKSTSSTSQAQASTKPTARQKRWVVDKPAWTETVVVKEAWDEPVYEKKAVHWVRDGKGLIKKFNTADEAGNYLKKLAFAGDGDASEGTEYKKSAQEPSITPHKLKS